MPTPTIETEKFEVEEPTANELLILWIEKDKIKFAIEQMKKCWNFEDVKKTIKQLENDLKEL